MKEIIIHNFTVKRGSFTLYPLSLTIEKGEIFAILGRVEDCYIRENTDYLLRSLKKVLSDKEYQVICCRYGLFGMEEETQREIARKLCISRSYVSRIEKTALQKLRGLFPQMQ